MHTFYDLRFWALIAILSVTSSFACATDGQFQGIGNHAATPNMISHASWLNELSERRRTNRFFVNQSPASHGVQKGYVNVGRGNVTFSNRSLISAGRLPIVMARVYDSSSAGADDFGPGWHLSLAETITVQTNGQLEYLDDSATVTTFASSTAGYQINSMQNNDIKSVQHDAEGLLQIDYKTGWLKRFKQLGNKYRLMQVVDNNGNRLNLHYTNNRLAKVVGANGHFVEIERTTTGQISQMIDDQARSVNFEYNRKGLMLAAYDLGGNLWRYKYHGTGLLHKVFAPLAKSLPGLILAKVAGQPVPKSAQYSTNSITAVTLQQSKTPKA